MAATPMVGSGSKDRHAQNLHYPKALADEEAALVKERREAAGITGPSTKGTQRAKPVLGVGLSGGGIRSATFSLGVFQALAAGRLVRHVDILSTVSGGGYFGSFLGRLFTRRWIAGPADVEAVLRGDEVPAAPGFGPLPFRWLRESSRYLAPRGSGDLFVLGAVVLRNWIAVQVALVVTVLTAFVALQIGRTGADAFLTLPAGRPLLAALTTLPGSGWLWWSPWLLVALAPFVLVSMPSAWAYWMVARREEKRGGWAPWAGLFLLLMLGFAGTVHFLVRPADQFVLHPYRWLVSFVPLAIVATILGRIRTNHRPSAAGWLGIALTSLASVSGMVHYWPLGGRLHYVAVFVLIVTTTAFAFWRAAVFFAIAPRSSVSWTDELRSGLTRWTTRGLEWTGLALAVALIDTIGATTYYFFSQPESSLGLWGAGLLASFVTVGTFARQASLLLAPKKADARPRVPISILLWCAALLIGALWLVAINAGSHAIAWQFGPPKGAPLYGPADFPPPALLGNDQVVVERRGDGFVVRGERQSAPRVTPIVPERPETWFLLISITLLASFTWMIGRTRSFINLSSVHALYAARLTRAYLGASNPRRFDGTKRVTDAIEGDDIDSDDYWCWPLQATQPDPDRRHTRSTRRGGPLHVINATINETMNVRSGVQNQDRKGLSLAIGPCAISVGASHHLVTSADGQEAVAFGPADDSVFAPNNPRATAPEELSLGRWMSISGAAFSAAAGANTSVPVAILAGLFNVRLGYWWDSGKAAGAWSLERLLPVQAALLAEMLARTKGTNGQWWNISDGGHFENMGGYELIRRRLTSIVIVDAEADPDLTFQGLSDLIRKARLDFGAEIRFCSEADLNDQAKVGEIVPSAVRPYFGDLDALRRGHWTEESAPLPAVADRVNRLSFAPDRTHVSRAHAALACVTYKDEEAMKDRPERWLIYVKATMMGDEPEDVRQYHRAHPDFPQETTNDQFFDERQWESYRRLGQHIGARVLAPVLKHVTDERG